MREQEIEAIADYLRRLPDAKSLPREVRIEFRYAGATEHHTIKMTDENEEDDS